MIKIVNIEYSIAIVNIVFLVLDVHEDEPEFFVGNNSILLDVVLSHDLI